MQIIFERFSIETQAIPPNPAVPEGAVALIITEEGTGNRFPLAIPKLQAIDLGMRILALSKGGEGNGMISPPPSSPVADEDIARFIGGEDPNEG